MLRCPSVANTEPHIRPAPGRTRNMPCPAARGTASPSTALTALSRAPLCQMFPST